MSQRTYTAVEFARELGHRFEGDELEQTECAKRVLGLPPDGVFNQEWYWTVETVEQYRTARHDAIRRCGELLKQIEPATGAHRKNNGADTLSRKQAARGARHEPPRQAHGRLRGPSRPAHDRQPMTIAEMSDHLAAALCEFHRVTPQVTTDESGKRMAAYPRWIVDEALKVMGAIP